MFLLLKHLEIEKKDMDHQKSCAQQVKSLCVIIDSDLKFDQTLEGQRHMTCRGPETLFPVSLRRESRGRYVVFLCVENATKGLVFRSELGPLGSITSVKSR